MIIFNPLDKFYKSDIGAVCADKSVTFRVKGDFDSVVFVLKSDKTGEENYFSMTKLGDVFAIDVKLEVGLYYYCFNLSNGKFIGLGNDYLGVITDNPVLFQHTVFSKDYSVPNWLNGGIIYQIFPDRFCCSGSNKKIEDGKVLHDRWSDTPIYEPNEFGQVLNNDFFGGDLKGITSKLDYLFDLGVTAIYLNPIFKAYSNHRYDTGNYMQIDPLLGTEEDLKELINCAKDKGIKIILDGVFNHTGDDSLYFNRYGNYDSLGAYQSKDSPYYTWYNFTNYPKNYEAWWGIKTLPSVNESNPDFINYITGVDGVLEHYTKLGVGGWRLDVVDELPSEFVKKIRKAVKGINNDGIIIGEVWEDASNKIAYGVRREYFQGAELDSVMNYPLKNAIINYVRNGDERQLSWVIKEQIDHYPKAVLDSLMNILSTHDTKRLITSLAGENLDGKTKKVMEKTFISEEKMRDARVRVKIASLLQYTLCGVPCVYYGDEIGMQGYIDPLNRRTYPWGNEDDELLSWYKFLGQLRSEISAFSNGEYEELFASGGAFVYARRDDKSEILVATNIGDGEYVINFEGKLYDYITKKSYTEEFSLKGNSIAVLIKKI